MKVTLFGATGKTGKYLINEGLKRGIDITAFARANSTFEHSKVRMVRGALTDKDLLREAIHGADTVLSALGPTSPRHPKDLPITKAAEAIISAMKEENVRRLIAVSTGTAVDAEDRFDLKIWLPALLIKFAMASSYQDIIGLARTIRTSTLDWTMVRVPFLNNSLASHHLNVGMYGHTKHALTISREEVSVFMFDQIAHRQYLNKAPGISAA